jgi:hypothetical protein
MECLSPGGALAADGESNRFLSSRPLRATFQGSVVVASKNLYIKNQNTFEKNAHRKLDVLVQIYLIRKNKLPPVDKVPVLNEEAFFSSSSCR